MSLADALREHAVTIKGPSCTVCALLKTLDKTDAKILNEALFDPSYTHTGIARALRAEGHNVSSSSLSRHRKGECAGGHR